MSLVCIVDQLRVSVRVESAWWEEEVQEKMVLVSEEVEETSSRPNDLESDFFSPLFEFRLPLGVMTGFRLR